MRTDDFISRLQRRVAQTAIGASALRNQGAPRVVAAARQQLAAINLGALRVADSATFGGLLNRKTREVLHAFPAEAKSWGGARKAVNLFLREVLYNRDLAHHYSLDDVFPLLEVPLDSHVATGLRAEPEGDGLPPWRSIKSLTWRESRVFQEVATRVASRKGVNRVDLDIYYWRPKDEA